MVNDLGNTDDLELMPTGGGYMVRRDRLMNELIVKGRKAGIVLLYAPDGFGKTSVLLQYVQEVKSDPTRGRFGLSRPTARLDASSLCSSRLSPMSLRTNLIRSLRSTTCPISSSTKPRTSSIESAAYVLRGRGSLLPAALQPIAYPRAGRFCKSQCADAQGARL